MIRIAILGCDSSHTEAYTSLINSPNGPFYGVARVCWIWGENNAQAHEKADALAIDHVLVTPDPEILKTADMIMVIGRFGDSHYEPATQAIVSGKPVFIDKPLTNNDEQAEKLVKLAKERGVPLMSFSPLRFSEEIISLRKQYPSATIQSVIATSPMITRTIQDDRVNSIYFYSIHAVDMLLSLVGKRPQAVYAHKHLKGVWADIVFEDGQVSVLNLTVDQPETYQVTVFDYNGDINNVNIDTDGLFYQHTLSFLLNNHKNIKTAEAPLTEALDSIRILTAVERSLTEQKKILLNEQV
jgi:predicted dehydrogenase